METENSKDNKGKVIVEIIQTGSEIGGGVGGAIIGGLLAGPAGGVIGGAAGPLLTRLFIKAGNEIKQRFFGEREKMRIGFTYGIGYQKINLRLEKGDLIRSDGFFDNSENNRSTADEILEGVIRSAEKEFEEKKLKFYGNLLANICFTTTINKDKAHYFLRTTQNLTYKQLCILQFIVLYGQQQLNWSYNFNHLDELLTYGSLEPLIEDLDRHKLLSVLRTSGLNISNVSISKLGKELADLMELNEIESTEITDIKEELEQIKHIIEQKK